MDTASVGDQRNTLDQPARLIGVVERVQQSSNERYLLLRLTEPTSAIAMIATYGYGNKTNASLAFYFYGDEAERVAESSREKWTRWLRELLRVNDSQAIPKT